MDNFSLDITAEGNATLATLLKLAFEHNAPGRKCSHYKIAKLAHKTSYFTRGDATGHSEGEYEDAAGRSVLLLLWTADKGATEHPFPMTAEDAASFVSGWLRNVDMGPEPDHDGDNGRGFRLFTEAWGHVAGHTYTICAIEPQWAMYGK